MKTPRIVRQVWAAILAALALATPVTASGADLTEFDLTRLYGKTIGDMADAQTPEGLVPDSAPEYVVFADGGRSDVIFAMNHQSEKPGYGYQLARGATSLTEAWNASPYSSQNHFMLGQIMEWFYGDLAGLAPDPTAPGFKNILVRPQPVAGIDWARATYESPRGKVRVAWRREAGRFYLEVEVPPNATATVFVPTSDASQVLEGKVAADRSPHVRRLSAQTGVAVFAVGSGSYAFTAPALSSTGGSPN